LVMVHLVTEVVVGNVVLVWKVGRPGGGVVYKAVEGWDCVWREAVVAHFAACIDVIVDEGAPSACPVCSWRSLRLLLLLHFSFRIPLNRGASAAAAAAAAAAASAVAAAAAAAAASAAAACSAAAAAAVAVTGAVVVAAAGTGELDREGTYSKRDRL
jgi:hypothetical protein